MRNFNLKRVASAVVLLVMALAANATLAVHVVEKSGGSETVVNFPDATGKISCTVTIANYSGNPSDYKYWVGTPDWDSNKSCEFSLASSNQGQCNASVSGSDYLKNGCTSGKVKFYIYTDSGDKNFYPHDLTTIESSECDVDAKGDAIPAGTVIFFDNSAGIFSGAVYLSVPTESGNGNAETVDQGTYVRNRDSWYQMIKVEGNIWQATIANASEYGRMSFWDKDGSSAQDVWQNTVVFQVPYNASKNVVKPTSTKCRNDNRETDYYPHATWSARQGLMLSASSNIMKAGDLNPITLKATAIGIQGTKYKFEYKPFDSSEWSTLVEQTEPEYVLQNSKLPSKSTYYRVTYGSVTSSEIKISVLVDCEEGGSAKNILKYDFGTLTQLKGDNSRKESDDMAEDYTYQPYPYKINDGYYAIVATPYYCGCGEGSDMSQTVEQCEGNNMWFRDIKDHTIGDKFTTGNYGAMLMINFSDAKSKIAYEHILLDDEKKAFVKGSTLSFSAYFANAAKETSTEPINMKLKIDYKAVGSSEWETKAYLDNNVTFAENWKYGSTSIDIDDPAGAYRVVIENNGQAGAGNDALIDDISLDLCVPTFPVEFYDETKGSTSVDYSFEKIDEKQTIRILKQDYGHGTDNCVFLLSVDKTKEVGEAGRYKFLAEMTQKKYGQIDYYIASKSALELLGGKTGSGNLQAFVTLPENCTDATKLATIKQKLENGEIIPLESSDNMFSTNILSYNLECNDAITAKFDEIKTVCEESGKLENDLPKIEATFGCIAQNVYYTLKEDGKALISDSLLKESIVKSGAFSIDLNSLSNVVRTAGEHSFTITIYEKATASSDKICEKTSNAIKLTVAPKPVFTTNLPTTAEKCDGVTKQISVAADNTKTYTWQKNEGSDWVNIEGATTSAYTLPEDAANGTKYRVIIGNDYCTTVTSQELTLTVNKCDKVTLSLTQDKQELCKGEEVVFKAEVTNLGDLAADVNITETIAEITGLEFVSSNASAGTFASNVWSVNSLAKDATATLELTYKATSSELSTNVEKLFVSKLGTEKSWATYDDQTDENMKGSVSVSTKKQLTGIALHDKDMAQEYDLSGVPTVKISLGAETEKVLTITPSDVQYTVRWYAGDAEFDGQFPRVPYVDVVYKAVVTDDCANSFEAKAGTQVEWPTIFMPYDNGTNQDFVTGAGIKVYVYDRNGNTIATSPDGWDGTANGKMAMPGVYYYKAELPDGSTHKGTVEVFKR